MDDRLGTMEREQASKMGDVLYYIGGNTPKIAEADLCQAHVKLGETTSSLSLPIIPPLQH